MAGNTQYINRGLLGPLSAVLLIVFSAIALYEFRIHTAMYGLDKRLKDIVDASKYPERSDITIRSHYTGIVALDYGLRFLVTVFLPSAAPFNDYQQAQLWNFLFAFFPIVVIISVEATRGGSRGSWIRYPSVWSLLYQTVGGAIILPIWFLLFLRHSAQTSKYDSSSVQLPLGYAKALLSAHVLGYLLPTLVMFLPFNDPDLSLKQVFIANWQPCPLYVSLLLIIIAQLYGSAGKIPEPSVSDLGYIKLVYACSLVVSALSHIFLLHGWTQSRWSIVDVFVPRMLSVNRSVSELLYYIFQLDFVFIFAAAVLAAYVTIVDLGELGRSNVSSPVAVVSLVLGNVLIGPGATVAAVWWWREDKLRLSNDEETRKVL